MVSKLRSLLARIGELFHHRRLDSELDEELRFHIEQLAEDNIRAGMAPKEARRQALIALGGMDKTKEECRDTLGVRLLRDLSQDVRYGLRQLRRAPGFTAVAVLTLALGIGANTAIFSVIQAVLLRPLPYPNGDHIVHLFGQTLSTGNFEQWKESVQSYDRFAAMSLGSGLATIGSEPERIRVFEVSADFFPLLGQQPVRGRAFAESDFRPDSPAVMLVSSRLWREGLGSDPNFIGRTIAFEDKPYVVIGLVPDHCPLPYQEIDAWLPLKPGRAKGTSALGLLKPGISLEAASAEAGSVAKRFTPYVRLRKGAPLITTELLMERLVGYVRPLLLLLAGTIGPVLLIGCANVANLSLARMGARRRELAVRGALGAGRGRVVRQLLTESLLLSMLGAAAGLLIARWCVPLFVSLSPYRVARLEESGMDARVLAFALLVAVLVTLIFGLVPALRGSRLNVQSELKEGGRGAVGSRADRRLRGALVIAEIAISLVLLVGAGLIVKAFLRLRPSDPGFDPHGKLTMRVSMTSGPRLPLPLQIAFVRSSLERLKTLGGGQASFISFLPLTGNTWLPDVWINGQQVAGVELGVWVHCRAATEDYFRQMKMPILEGREFSAADDEHAVRVGVINQAMARRFWGSGDPVGRRIEVDLGGGQRTETMIVGLVRDARISASSTEPQAELYLPYAQAASPGVYLVLDAPGDPLKMTATAKQVLRSVAPDLVFADIRTMDQILSDAIAEPRFQALLLGLLAGLAFVLAMIGIYGVMSYSAGLRAHEIGVRMALGARRSSVLAMILREAGALIAFGVASGLLGAFALTRLLKSMLYGTSPTDPAAFAGAVVVLALVGAAACAIPAWRATRIDPLAVLRSE